MRALFALALLALPALAQDIVVDRKGLAELLAKKGLKSENLGFDFEHLDSMPPNYVASHSNTKSKEGQLAVWRRVQNVPVEFPEEVQKITGRIQRDEMWEAIAAALDRELPPREVPVAVELPDLRDDLRAPVGTILAAMEKKEPALIWRAVVEARPALEAFKGEVEYAKDGVVVTSAATPADASARLTIRFGGNDTYKGAWGGADGAGVVRVLIDVSGNDTYEAGEEDIAQGAAQNGGIAFHADFGGNDTYRTAKYVAQGAALGGTGVLWDAGGNDTYEAEGFAQGAAQDGVGLLVDDAGNDRFTLTGNGQGYGGQAAFGLLLDRAGDDLYHARDAAFGDKVTVPAPQDEKHNANMAQGAAFGHNGQPFRAGGVGLLLDVAGDDRYEAGCWAQGVGYFQAIGACIDLAGNDSYEAWVYVMGSGAHGGFGIQLDARGDDVYKVGGWNGPAMSVDYGIGFFLDGRGNDQYLGPASGLGTSIGLGISLFQDGGGDDLYQPKDDRIGFGVLYGKEDYNEDGKVTPAEKRHWGLFLDLAGSDRFPKPRGNGMRWDPAEFSGGLDVADAKPDFAPGKARLWDGTEVDASFENWESVQPIDLLKLLKGDAATKAEYAFSHGLRHEGSDLLALVADPKPLLRRHFDSADRTYSKDLHLWVTAEEAAWGAKVGALDPGAMADASWPRWVREAVGWRAKAAAWGRRDAAIARVRAWLDDKDVQALLARKKELEMLRTAARSGLIAADPKAAEAPMKKLAAYWATRKTPSVPCGLRNAAADLTAADPGWEKRYPVAAANAGLETVTLETVALTPEERALILPAPDLSALGSAAKAILAAVNAERQMLGRPPLLPDETLMKIATGTAKGGKAAEGLPKFEGTSIPLTAKGNGPAAALDDLEKVQVNRSTLLDPQWTAVGVGAGANNNYVVIVGKKK
ncbi:MAG: hypothetical protein FD180_4161 [Planctomycetota bacterium]|nr:MAG: hypothetical protein FD180_4161 [Planctomycetota bacterium]